ncbi:fungal-specific transcription factor domain-containing protein [Dactylonectria estremocensis]|uniref:Fungal-specific transcription factor domain-containing protein n=1 Tax=Dactylonectria estremocensis TaxID=1079267 RepID=A0A9P9IYP2_9HYPO|nr:fungal-specific transcription factor domain-containing protein [Dactylonectria estremocensis]
MTTDTVAAALVLARHEINNGNFGSTWMLSSVATRAALALGLNTQGRVGEGSLSFREQETRRRLFWSCYCLDRMMSTGRPELVVLRAEHITLQLPCEEHQYSYDIPCWTPIKNLEEWMPSDGQLQAQVDIGLFGHYVQIMQMRYCMLKYVRNHPEQLEEVRPWDATSSFAQCVHKISMWKQSLLPQFQLLPDTIHARQSQDQLLPLIMLHVWYEQCMSDLYRIVMPGFPETLPASMLLDAPAGWVQQHQSACVRHASNIAAILESVAAMVDVESFVFLDTSLPMCIFDSICVRLQGLFMPQFSSVGERVEECKASFVTLMGYVERMARYFQQAQWLLEETRNVLFRHGISIHGMSEPNSSNTSSNLPDTNVGSHPWHKRIQHLKDNSKSYNWISQQINPGPGQKQTNSLMMIVPSATNQGPAHADVNLSKTSVHDNSPYETSQSTNLDSLEHRPMEYQNGPTLPPHGWGEAVIIPNLSSFVGIGGEWLANGVDISSDHGGFTG